MPGSVCASAVGSLPGLCALLCMNNEIIFTVTKPSSSDTTWTSHLLKQEIQRLPFQFTSSIFSACLNSELIWTVGTHLYANTERGGFPNGQSHREVSFLCIRFTVGGLILAHFADKYCSEDSTLRTKQTTYIQTVSMVRHLYVVSSSVQMYFRFSSIVSKRFFDLVYLEFYMFKVIIAVCS
jgi:hypothetical protein